MPTKEERLERLKGQKEAAKLMVEGNLKLIRDYDEEIESMESPKAVEKKHTVECYICGEDTSAGGYFMPPYYCCGKIECLLEVFFKRGMISQKEKEVLLEKRKSETQAILDAGSSRHEKKIRLSVHRLNGKLDAWENAYNRLQEKYNALERQSREREEDYKELQNKYHVSREKEEALFAANLNLEKTVGCVNRFLLEVLGES